MKFLVTYILGAAIMAATPSVAAAQRGEPHKKTQPAPAPKKAAPAQTKQNDGYGRWDKNWGSRPPSPPKHWTKKSDWHRHVRACQQKYRSYNARTDTYRTNTGKARRCPL